MRPAHLTPSCAPSFLSCRTAAFATLVGSLLGGCAETPMEAADGPAVDGLVQGDGGAPDCTARSLVDRADEQQGYQVHLLYVVPADGEDRALDQGGLLAGSVSSWQGWFGARAGGAHLRVDTCAGRPDISFVRLPTAEAQIRGMGAQARDEIERGVRAAGFRSEHKIYVAFYDGRTLGASCGGAPLPPTRTYNVTGIYLRGEFADVNIPPCSSNPITAANQPPTYFEFTTVHEVLHTIGMAPPARRTPLAAATSTTARSTSCTRGRSRGGRRRSMSGATTTSRPTAPVAMIWHAASFWIPCP